MQLDSKHTLRKLQRQRFPFARLPFCIDGQLAEGTLPVFQVLRFISGTGRNPLICFTFKKIITLSSYPPHCPGLREDRTLVDDVLGDQPQGGTLLEQSLTLLYSCS